MIAAVALAARLAVVAWAAGKFPPAADGTYYHAIATRLAEGAGYTWVWPDGAVTYAAHYPIGYPATLAALYAVFGAKPVVAMILHAVLGALGTFAIHRLAWPMMTPRRALAAGLVVALHPALVPYTAALMTEAVTAAWLAIACALAAEARASERAWKWRALAGIVMGIATLTRPQVLVLAPLLGVLSTREIKAYPRVVSAIAVTAITVACCLPWTARNCVRMHRCALVSVNAGWNLLIGEETESGGWGEIQVPETCREVWDEAAKDACFERAARERIAASPGRWLSKIPTKLSVTFDYFGAAPWYLHTSNAAAFPESAKLVLGVVETVVSRILLVAALLVSVGAAGARSKPRVALALLGVAFAVTSHGWVALLVLALLTALVPLRAEDSPLLPWTVAVIVATAITHAAFFGAGRYGLVVVPFVSALAFLPPRTTSPSPDKMSFKNSSSSG
ncbi:MAG: glycosyltransferase family 39 protein [Polyangiaceae bacterium]